MPPPKGIDKIEVIRGEGFPAKVHIIETKVAPFAKRLSIAKADTAADPASRRSGLDEFFRLAEKTPRPIRPRPTPAIQTKPAATKPPPVNGFLSLFQNLAFYLRHAVKASVGALGSGFGGPMMIFGFLLFPGREFRKTLESLDKELSELDRVRDMEDSGQPLNAQDKAILENPELHALDKKRELLKIEYQNSLLAVYDKPDIRLQEEVKKILQAEVVDSPLGLIPSLAHYRKVPTDFYAGVLLRHADADTIRDYLEEWAASIPRDKQLNFPLEVIRWMQVYRLDARAEFFKRYLRSEDPLIQLEAAEALLEMGDGKAAFATIESILHEHPQVFWQVEAAMLLSRYGDKKLAPVMLDFMRRMDHDLDAQVIAAEFLGRWDVFTGKLEVVALFNKLQKLFAEGKDPYLHFGLMLRTAKALSEMSIRVSVLENYGSFLNQFRTQNAFYDSTLLEGFSQRVLAREGSSTFPLQRATLQDSRMPLEIRAGAAAGLAKSPFHEDVREAWEVLQSPNEAHGVRAAVLKILVERFPTFSGLKEIGYELLRSPLLFVRQQAIDVLISLGEGSQVTGVIRHLLSQSKNELGATAKDLKQDNLPFKDHEAEAVNQFDRWATEALKRSDPDWESEWRPFKWEQHQEIFEREWTKSEHEKPLSNLKASYNSMEGSEIFIGKSLTEIVMGAAMEVSAGRSLAKETVEQLKKLSPDAVGTLVLAAKQNRYAISALIFLHQIQNPHAHDALLRVDLSLHIKIGPDLTMMKILNELAKIGHPEADKVYKKWTN